jgi:hypothetical protein
VETGCNQACLPGWTVLFSPLFTRVPNRNSLWLLAFCRQAEVAIEPALLGVARVNPLISHFIVPAAEAGSRGSSGGIADGVGIV